MQVATEVDSGIAIFPVSHKYPVHLNKKPQCGVSGLLSLIIYNKLTLYSNSVFTLESRSQTILPSYLHALHSHNSRNMSKA